MSPRRTYYVDDERGVHRLWEFKNVIAPEISDAELQQLEEEALHPVSTVTLFSFEEFVEFVQCHRN